MRRIPRSILLFLLAALLLAGTAIADFGPKPLLFVKMVNAPEEPYYLDLLEEGNLEDLEYVNGGLDWEWSTKSGPIDEELLALFLSAVPDGWHACTAQGARSLMWGDLPGTMERGVRIHNFGYTLPRSYRILAVTASGETWISDAMSRSAALQSSVTVDWAAKTVKVPPVWVGYVMQFLATLLPTLLIEGLILLAFRFDWRRNWRAFLLVNLLTQGALSAAVAYCAVGSGFNVMWYVLLIVPAEVLIALVEAGLYCKLLRGRSKARAFVYGLTANAASALLGWFLAEPVWRWVVTIC